MKKAVILLAGLLMLCSARAESAKDAWTRLVGAKSAKHPAYAYVENNAKLPNVFIYGDSISIGFTPYVRKSLMGKANVYRLQCNGGDSSTIITKMDALHKVMCDKNLEGCWDFNWDVIQLNVGLHDLKYMNGKKLDLAGGTQVNSVEKYVENLETALQYLKKRWPKAKIIFATTTPVPAASAGRKEGDAKRYNEAALKLLKKYPDVIVNDLYSFTLPNQKKWWAKPGNVHFTHQGCEAQGKETAKVILKALEKK